MCLAQLSGSSSPCLKSRPEESNSIPWQCSRPESGHTHSLGNDTTGAEEDIITMIAYSGHINLSARFQAPNTAPTPNCHLQTTNTLKEVEEVDYKSPELGFFCIPKFMTAQLSYMPYKANSN
jgi:hypothetical protein